MTILIPLTPQMGKESFNLPLGLISRFFFFRQRGLMICHTEDN
jgi:hypothetical protein